VFFVAPVAGLCAWRTYAPYRTALASAKAWTH
jgi:hypothetical protein